jgi:hypothetical protein
MLYVWSISYHIVFFAYNESHYRNEVMMVKEVHESSMNIERNTDLYMEYLELAAMVAFLECTVK